MKNSPSRCLFILLAVVCVFGVTSCKKKPEDATKQIISELFDDSKAGKNADVAVLMTSIMPEREKQRMKKDRIDYALPDDKSRIDGMCRQINSRYGEGYEFGNYKSQPKGDGSEVVGWEVFPKGANEGQIVTFSLENGKYVMFDIDPAKR